jgi:UTP--glucose-1-phosphate uridylyltransferase
MAPINKVVIPMAGRGTRFHPITHVVPKEFLPILNRPLFHLIAEQVVAAGCIEMICVVNPGRDFATPYLDAVDLDLQVTLVAQTEQKGLGHAVGCAESAVGDEHFFVLLPDVVIDAPVPVAQQMREAFESLETGGLIATRPEPKDTLSSYGVIKPGAREGRCLKVDDLVEKPPVGQAPSNFTVTGQYLLPPSTFQYLRETPPGVRGEIQLTDALRTIAQREGLYALEYDETAMFDCGQPPGWLAANNYFAKKAGLA